MESKYILDISYLAASITFILGLKMLSNPEKARKGNLVAASGMLLAIFTTIFLYRSDSGRPLSNYLWIFGGIFIGSIIGTLMARKVKMTAMPQMVSMFNGLGALCAALISISEFSHETGGHLFNGKNITIFLAMIIGCVSFSGSMIAFGKLEGKIKDFSFKMQQILNTLLLFVALGISYYSLTLPAPNMTLLYVVCGIALVYGIMFVFPIGGADMPVVISLLNSFTGMAAAFGGFLYNNQVMLTGGILVGSSGTILTILMCKAMNRSLMNVIIGSFGGTTAAAGKSGVAGSIKEVSINDAAIMMSYARKVMIIPGYGLAVAQAQHTCKELEKQLEEKGVEVSYAIHPVAGRMPGHMNVLLAEADVSYDKLIEMDDANMQFDETDVALVLGANDVVNPAAKNDPSSPIYGMPILEAEMAKNIIVNKRSMNPGYAGIENELFYNNKTKMLFGDAKKVLEQLVTEVRNN